MPLTHREHTSAVTFVTGHAVAGIDWSKVGLAETLVIFMGLTTFPEIALQLIAHGRSPDTPAMAVRWATRPDQQTIVGTLASLPSMLAGMKPPATIVVGEVVRLRDKLDWFERLPLFGKRIVVTRAREQADALGSRLAALGANGLSVDHRAIRGAAWLRYFQSRGYVVWGWTVNDAGRMRRLAGWGIDAILSDNPALLCGTMRQKS